jgi:hypothetical protein
MRRRIFVRILTGFSHGVVRDHCGTAAGNASVRMKLPNRHCHANLRGATFVAGILTSSATGIQPAPITAGSGRANVVYF